MSGVFHAGRLRRAIIVAPHPDDETIGAFGLIRQLVRVGVDVRAVIVTDGCASHPSSAAWPPARLRAARQRESLAALRLAGLSRGAVRFLDYPDGGLARPAADTWRDLVRDLSAGPRPDLVVRPSLRDDHPDHRAVARACRAAWPPAVRQISYQVWPAGQRVPHAARLCLGADQALKQAALRLYRTQTGAITDDPSGFCIVRSLMRSFAGPAEYFGEDR